MSSQREQQQQDQQHSNVFLVWGKNGWIGNMIYQILLQQNKTVHVTDVRTQNQADVRAELEKYKPTHVINCAGKTGRPNVDWCETHKLETLESNCMGTYNVTYECYQLGIHCTLLATGCIYTSTYTPNMTTLISKPFLETDPPNFSGSFYSATKAALEALLKHYPNHLILRLRMPVSADLSPRSFVTKILRYARVVSVPNSHSLLPDLLPIAIALAEHRETGVYNFTNPGAISHNEVLQLFRELVEPGRTWENFTVEQQREVIVAERSNCELDCGKLVAKVEEYRREEGRVELQVLEVREAYRRCFREIREGIEAGWIEGLQVLGGAVKGEGGVSVR